MTTPLTRQSAELALAAAALAFEVALADVRSSHRPQAALARHAVYAALRYECAASLDEIGQALRRHHSTILYGIEVAKAHLDNPDFVRRLDTIRAVVRTGRLAGAAELGPSLAALGDQLHAIAPTLSQGQLAGLRAELRRMVGTVEAALAPREASERRDARLWRGAQEGH